MDALPAQGASARLLKIVWSNKTWLGGSLCVLVPLTLVVLWVYATPQYSDVLDYVVWGHDNTTSCAGPDTPLFCWTCARRPHTPITVIQNTHW